MKLVVVNLRTGKCLGDRIKLAADDRTRKVGLLDRDSLEPGEGLLIAPGNAIHTIGMRFPISVAFLGEDGEILRIWTCPPGIKRVSQAGAITVLELPCGALDRSLPGDRLSLQKLSEA